MKTIKFGGLLILFLLSGACSEKPKSSEKYFDFDGLLEDQIDQLSQRSRVLDKMVDMGGEKSDSTFLPSGAGWNSELEIFRNLELINRPTYKGAYAIADPLADAKSNLKIREYTAMSSPVPLVRFYYQDQFERIKKIEAVITRNNFLFKSRRLLTMEFDEDDGKPLLIRYSMKGFQKMILTDTVHFSLQGQIDW